MIQENTKTLVELRKACKAHGIQVKKQTFSWGPHISFKIGGIDASSVLSREFYEEHRSSFEALVAIKQEFHGMVVDGRVAVGLKPEKD